jgi:hypothetical protein
MRRIGFYLFNAAVAVGMCCSHAWASDEGLTYSDDFEFGFGNWSNVTAGDNKNWMLDSGGTPSVGTGPATGANGSKYYAYLETSSGFAYTAGDTAILLGPSITGMDVHLTFQYHMYGADIGTLSVDVLSGDAWINDIWSVSGQQQWSNSAAYAAADVDLSSYTVSQIRFRAVAAGGYRGDIALDNIELRSIPIGPVAPVFNDDPLVKSDASSDQPYQDSIAEDASDANGDRLIFSKISGPDWLNVAADGELSGTPDPSDIGINKSVVEVSDGALSSRTAIIINVKDGSLPLVLSSSDFETGFGDWNNVTGDDSHNWTRDSGGTPSVGTGPATGADGSNYYLYLETSSGSAYAAGDTAILESCGINATNVHLGFQYHMYGADIGTLSVDVLSGGAWINDVWSISGQQQSANGAAYTAVDVDLSSYDVTQIRLRATAVGGYRGDIAVDNLIISGIGSINNGGGAQAKIVFVTSQGFTGKLGGLAGADAICQAEATAAGLAGTFKAFLSDNKTSAADRMTHSSIPYELVNGTPIAADWQDIVDGIIDNPLNITASGATVSGYVWTGSNSDGSKAYGLTCDNWTLGANSLYLGARGNAGDPRAWLDWWQGDGSYCGSYLGLYCIEQ